MPALDPLKNDTTGAGMPYKLGPERESPFLDGDEVLELPLHFDQLERRRAAGDDDTTCGTSYRTREILGISLHLPKKLDALRLDAAIPV
uniref:Uncharacterized protein n=1 Tax=Melanopsichium pennsylvanicum 4 TaxID=1398559 RepID=A0A077QXH6_9BASI|nr:uncharacterized protein BN887_06016 [Melanopsichium pennsylvanicum 4]